MFFKQLCYTLKNLIILWQPAVITTNLAYGLPISEIVLSITGINYVTPYIELRYAFIGLRYGLSVIDLSELFLRTTRRSRWNGILDFFITCFTGWFL